MTALAIVIISAVTSTYALVDTLVTIRRGRKKISTLEQELAAAYLAQGYATMSLRALSVWRDNQMKGRYDRIAGEIEALKAAAKHHEDALREQREHVIRIRRETAEQFAAGIRACLLRGDRAEVAVEATLANFPTEVN